MPLVSMLLLLTQLSTGSQFVAGLPILDYEVALPPSEERVLELFGALPEDLRPNSLTNRRIELAETVKTVALECRVAGHLTWFDEDVVGLLTQRFSDTVEMRAGRLGLNFTNMSHKGLDYLLGIMQTLRTELDAVGGEKTLKGKRLLEEANIDALPDELAILETAYMTDLYKYVAAHCGGEEITPIPEPNPRMRRVKLN